MFGAFDIALFNRTYEKYKNILKKGNLISMKGRLSLRDGQRPSVVVEKIELWDDKNKELKNDIEEVEVIKQKNCACAMILQTKYYMMPL